MRKTPFGFMMLLPQVGMGLMGLLGLVLLLWPDILISMFPPLIGLTLILVGVLGIAAYAATRNKNTQAEQGFKLLQSIATLAVGVVFVLNNDVSGAFLAILFGLYVIVTSVLGVGSVIRGKLRGKDLAAGLIQSAVYLVWGLMLLFAPFSGKDLWARFLGGYFLLTAVIGIIRLRGVQKQIEERFHHFTRGHRHEEDEPEA